jgi:hypothetical protein
MRYGGLILGNPVLEDLSASLVAEAAAGELASVEPIGLTNPSVSNTIQNSRVFDIAYFVLEGISAVAELDGILM